jgi:hypothetical protein
VAFVGEVFFVGDEVGEDVAHLLAGEEAGHGRHPGDRFAAFLDLVFADHFDLFDDFQDGVSVFVIGEEGAANDGAVLEGDGPHAEAFGDFRVGVDEGAEEVGGVAQLADGTEFRANVSADAVEGVATLALAGGVAINEGFAEFDIAADFAEEGPFGVGIILG